MIAQRSRTCGTAPSSMLPFPTVFCVPFIKPPTNAGREDQRCFISSSLAPFRPLKVAHRLVRAFKFNGPFVPFLHLMFHWPFANLSFVAGGLQRLAATLDAKFVAYIPCFWAAAASQGARNACAHEAFACLGRPAHCNEIGQFIALQ